MRFAYWWRWTSNFYPALDAMWIHPDVEYERAYLDEEPWAFTWAVLFAAMVVVAVAS